MSQFFLNADAGPISPDIPTSFVTDVGTAVPAGNIIIFHGVGGTFSGSGNTVTFTVSGSGFVWIDQATPTTILANTGYFVTEPVILTMPVAPHQGDTVFIISANSLGFLLQASPGQTFRVGSGTSVVGGVCISSEEGDAVEFTYRAADATWYCSNSPEGNIEVE